MREKAFSLREDMNLRKRGFEIIQAYRAAGIELPARKTSGSAGYDLAAACDCILKRGEVSIVPTGLKAYMQEDEYLGIHIRSGLSLKHRLMLVNSQGVIDSDYYDNTANEGHIMVAVLNLGAEDVPVEKGMRIAQGIFYKYLAVDGDTSGQGAIRHGGFGSTGED